VHASACDVTGWCMHLTNLCMHLLHALPHDIKGQCMQLLHGLLYLQLLCQDHTSHRYLKKSRLLKFCYEPATSAASSKGIFAAQIVLARRAVPAISQSIFLRCLWYKHLPHTHPYTHTNIHINASFTYTHILRAHNIYLCQRLDCLCLWLDWFLSIWVYVQFYACG
jgi:hypothetical protein